MRNFVWFIPIFMQERHSSRRIVDGYHKAFIDSSIEAESSYSPQFISNSNGKKVLTVIENELKGCDDLFISVAFITMGGITPLLQALRELGYHEIDADNAKEVLDKIAEIQSRKV